MRHPVNNKEKPFKDYFTNNKVLIIALLSVGNNTLVWQAMNITVKERVEKSNDIIVGKEEYCKDSHHNYLGYCSNNKSPQKL